MSTDIWVKVTIAEGNEVYGKLVRPEILEELTGTKKTHPAFFELQKTAKMEWSRDEKTGEPLPSIVPLAPPGSAGSLFLRTEVAQSISIIPENSNLTKSLMSHYSGIRLATTMPAGLGRGSSLLS
jgi:hypothetical protein